MADVIAASGLTIGMLLFAAGFVLAFFWPFAMWLMVRHLRGIRTELERMNEHMEKRAFIEAPPREYTKMGTLVTR